MSAGSAPGVARAAAAGDGGYRKSSVPSASSAGALDEPKEVSARAGASPPRLTSRGSARPGRPRANSAFPAPQASHQCGSDAQQAEAAGPETLLTLPAVLIWFMSITFMKSRPHRGEARLEGDGRARSAALTVRKDQHRRGRDEQRAEVEDINGSVVRPSFGADRGGTDKVLQAHAERCRPREFSEVDRDVEGGCRPCSGARNRRPPCAPDMRMKPSPFRSLPVK